MPSQQDLGQLEALEVEMDGSGVSPAWLLESVTVSRGENSHSFAGAPPAGWWFFPHGKWLGQSSVLSGPQPATARIKAEWHTGIECNTTAQYATMTYEKRRCMSSTNARGPRCEVLGGGRKPSQPLAQPAH